MMVAVSFDTLDVELHVRTRRYVSLQVLSMIRAAAHHQTLSLRCMLHRCSRTRQQYWQRSTLRRNAHCLASGAREINGKLDLIKAPGTAESLDWAATLLALGARDISPELAGLSLGALLKYQDDIAQVRALLAS